MYLSPSPRERLTSGALSLGIVAMVGYGLVVGLALPVRHLVDNAMPVLDFALPPPPTPKEKRRPPEPRRKARPQKHAASPENLKAEASPIVVPPLPPIVVPSPVIAAIQPNIGMAAHNGASDRSGSGQGAGGSGNGTGGGGDGDGGDTPPHQIRGKLGFSDMPAALRAEGAERTIGVRYAVDVDGRASDCRVTRSSGNAELDAITCDLIEKRFRFEPSRDGSGQPVRSVIVQNHSWNLDRSGYDSGG